MPTRRRARRLVQRKGRFIREVAIEDASGVVLHVRAVSNDAALVQVAIAQAEGALGDRFPDSWLLERRASARGRPRKHITPVGFERWEAALRLRQLVHPEVRRLRTAAWAGEVGLEEVARRLRRLVGRKPAENKVLACAHLVIGHREVPRTIASKVVQLAFPQFSLGQIGQDLNHQLPSLSDPTEK